MGPVCDESQVGLHHPSAFDWGTQMAVSQLLEEGEAAAGSLQSLVSTLGSSLGTSDLLATDAWQKGKTQAPAQPWHLQSIRKCNLR